MSETARLILAAMACYRLTQLLVYDAGPWEVLHRLRVRAGQSEAGKALACPYCTGVWVALAVGLLVLARHPLADAVLLWWGMAGTQSLLETRFPGGEA